MSVSNNPPDTNSCIIQQTMDEQLNYNLAELVTMIIKAFQDGIVSPKNTERLQNLTVDDIIDLVIKKIPDRNITSYITQNGTTIVEMIDSYNIIKDTKFVNSDFLEFQVITRREDDPSDPTGITKIDVPYIKAKLPYDLINKDRIVQIYLTTKNDDNDNTITNDILFEYKIDFDQVDPKKPYVIEARAAKLDIGKTKVFDVTTHPTRSDIWGTWSDEKYVIVSYLVDYGSWDPEPIEVNPNPTVNYVSKVTGSSIIPMTWGGSGVTNNEDGPQKPNENVTLEYENIRLISYENGTFDANVNPINSESIPTWIVIKDQSEAKLFDNYVTWFATAAKLIQQQSISFEWRPNPLNPDSIESNAILITPTNKIISQETFDLQSESSTKNANESSTKIIEQFVSEQFTYLKPTEIMTELSSKIIEQETFNIMAEEFIKFGASIGKEGLATKIIELSVSNKIEIGAISKLVRYGTITEDENVFSLFAKFNDGQQYPFLTYTPIYLPTRIVNFLSGKFVGTFDTTFEQYPVRIIEQVRAYLTKFNLEIGTSYLPIPNFVINFLSTLDIRYSPNCFYDRTPTWFVARENSEILEAKESVSLEHESVKIILEEDAKNFNSNIEKIVDNLNTPSRVILQDFNEKNPEMNTFTQWKKDHKIIYLDKELIVDYSKYLSYYPTWIVNQVGLYPAKMEVHSGTIAYIQDKYNMRVISSLNKEELVPLIMADGRQQRSEYEIVASQEQRVFDIKHNPDMVTVYRQGFKLSHGDYYSNGSKIILKSPANAGEIINIISERKYVFSNTVTKEELNNALNQMKTERPILTYPATAFEKSTVEIKIENFDSSIYYHVDIKFNGRTDNEIVWVKRQNKILIDIPEIKLVSRKSLSIVVYAGMSGKLQSTPTEALIMIKNLFDTLDGEETQKIVIGSVPTVWYGKQNTNYTFDELKSPKSIYSNLNEITNPYPIGKRIGIAPNNYYQSVLINTGTFTGTFIDGAIGLENLPDRSFEIIQSNGSETIFATNKTPEEIQKAFETGTLYFIVDNSTNPESNSYRIPTASGYDGNRYSYQPALEFTSTLNILPRTDKTDTEEATWYLEHNNSLRGRFVRAALILDINFIVDFDFDEQAIIDEDSEITKRKQLIEEVKYQVQDNVPHLLITINDPKIPNITNPYINIGSKFEIPTDNENINALQREETLLVNNLYAERIFSGKHLDLSSKDKFTNTMDIMNRSKRYKKFIPFTPTALMGHDTYYKKDFYVLNEDDVNLDPTKSIVSIVRFFNDKNIITDDPSYSIRVRELQEIEAIPESFKGIYFIPNELMGVDSAYSANLAHIQYGGVQVYVDDTGTDRNLIEQKFTYRKLYVLDTKTPQDLISGRNPKDFINSPDGFHVIAGAPKMVRIPSWWDVVLRPSVRPNRMDSLRDIWYLIRDGVPLTDQRWLKLTDGILKNSRIHTHTELLGSIRKNSDVVSIPDKSQLFLFGGIGYRPIQTRKINGAYISNDYLNALNKNPNNPSYSWYLNNLKYAYSKRSTNQYNSDGEPIGGWRNKTDILAFNYGWENGEPYVDFAWAKHYRWTRVVNDTHVTYDGIQLFVDRISRVQSLNRDIYHLDLTKLDRYSPSDNDIFPTFITKIVNENYKNIYRYIPPPGGTGAKIEDLGTNITEKAEFQDMTYDATTSTWWMTIKPAFSRNTKLYKFNTNYTIHASGTGISLTSFNWEEVIDLHLSPYELKAPTDTNLTRWSLLPDITSTLRGDGPMLIKHEEDAPYGSGQTKTLNPGIYYYDTWLKELYLKKLDQEPNKINLPMTSAFFGVPEITNIRNPYIVQLDANKSIEDRIDIVGSRIFMVVYLDKIISKMNLELFNLFKEEILHIENKISMINPDKHILILPNIIPIGVKTILPDGDNYRATSAQVLLNRVSTQTGRAANNLVFRLTNKDNHLLEVENIRFQTL